MASRKAPGGVVEPNGQRRSWGIRFRAYGKRYTVSLGRPEDGWSRRQAEDELANVLTDVRRGIWRPPELKSEAPEPKAEPTFHEFATDWLRARESELRERTLVDYRWRLSTHLLPHFATFQLSAITVEEVDRYRHIKAQESKDLRRAREEQTELPPSERKRLARPLSNGSINKMIRLLASILEQAVEYGYIDRNPAKGRRRLLKESKPNRSFAQPSQVAALLDAANALDAATRKGDSGRRRPLLATLALGGLRIGETLDLRWRDVSLGSQRLRVARAKTDAGVRDVALSPTLLEALTEYRTRTSHGDPDDYVFPTASGRRDSESNVRTRILAPAVQKANESLKAEDADPMPKLTPHSLRRTFFSLLLRAGVDLPRVMAEGGHADPKMTLGIYAQVLLIDDNADQHLLEALVGRGYLAASAVYRSPQSSSVSS